MDNSVIGKFCSVAKKGTIILPKHIDGYISPEGQVLEQDGQKITFDYTPILYNITYDFAGGKPVTQDQYKNKYTVESEVYLPPIPVKDWYMFEKWEPTHIDKGSIGDVNFVAKWKPYAVLLQGDKLNKKLLDYAASSLDNICSIVIGDIDPDNCINLSSTSTPIYATLKDRVLYINSDTKVYCNIDMSGAFSGLDSLYDISALRFFACKTNTNINSLFKGCKLLADTSPVDNWANGQFSDIRDAFTDTLALESHRLPQWYNWNVKISYKSSTGKIIEFSEENRIPKEIIYPKAFRGYKSITTSITIDEPNKEYEFVYEPIVYSIEYTLDGGEILNPKTSYIIEDEAYYPPEAVKPGFKFSYYTPEYIPEGSSGNITFIATYTV